MHSRAVEKRWNQTASVGAGIMGAQQKDRELTGLEQPTGAELVGVFAAPPNKTNTQHS